MCAFRSVCARAVAFFVLSFALNHFRSFFSCTPFPSPQRLFLLRSPQDNALVNIHGGDALGPQWAVYTRLHSAGLFARGPGPYTRLGSVQPLCGYLQCISELVDRYQSRLPITTTSHTTTHYYQSPLPVTLQVTLQVTTTSHTTSHTEIPTASYTTSHYHQPHYKPLPPATLSVTSSHQY